MASQPLLGVYVGNSAPADEQAFNAIAQWLGHKPDFATIFFNHNSWSEFDSSVQWALDQWPAHEKLLISMPLIPNGAMLGAAGSGAYDQHYLAAAQKIAAYDPNATVRVGWEMNGDGWWPWSAAKDPAGYVAAFRDLVTVFRSVSPNFKFDWSPNVGTQAIDPAKVYPGDAYVDTIGMSIYEGSSWFAGKTPEQRWDWLMNQPNGLAWQRDFAAVHGKPMSYGEYSSDFNDGAFVTEMANWIKSNNVAFHSWWDVNDTFNGDLNAHPGNKQAFATAWGGAASTPTPAPTPTPTPTGTGADTLVLHLSEDAWQGDAKFTVTVDGKQIATGQSVTASHAAGQTQDLTYHGDFGAGAHNVAVTFLNDAYGGSTQTDRNLYVNGLEFNGQHASANASLLYSGATGTFTVSGAATPNPTPTPTPSPTPAPSGTGKDTLVLHLSEDAFQGDAQFTVAVDGVKLGAAQSVTASHALGQTQDFTFHDDFGTGAHNVAVTFLNDAYGGSTQTDRNLYVNGAEFNGQHANVTASLLHTGATATFAVSGSASPTPTPTPSAGPVITDPAAHATPVEARAYVAPDSTGTAHGTAGSDDIFATADGQNLIGGGGNDVFHISSNVNSHITVGTSGITTVSTYAVNYTLAAGVDNLQLQGTYAHTAAGNGRANYIVGSDGNDTINGGGGDDTIVVGTGANKITGGGGQHELFVFSKAADHGNVITDFHAGSDMLDLRAMMKDAGYAGADPIADHTLQVSQHGADTTIDLAVNGTSHTVVTLQNVLASSLHPGQDYIWH